MNSDPSSDADGRTRPATVKLPRAQRREQLLAAATGEFVQVGYAATNLNRLAAGAGVSRMILYRHFESKADVYRAALERAIDRLVRATGNSPTEETIAALLTWANDDPDAFRLLFRSMPTEPQFHEVHAKLRADMTTALRDRLTADIRDPQWADWAAKLGLSVVVEAILAWLDVGRPQLDRAAERIDRTVAAVIAAAADD